MTEKRWHKVAQVDDLPDGRVTTVQAGEPVCVPDPLRGPVRRPRQPLPAPGRPARRGLDREGLLRCPWHGYDYDPLTGTAARRASATPPRPSRSRSATTASTSRSPTSRRTCAPSPTSWSRRWSTGASPTCSGWSATPTSASPTRCAARRRRASCTFIGIRHEGAAAFAASAYGKLTGRPAACFGIAGPGSTNLLTGLYDAKVDRAPVLALSGQVPSKVLGRGAFQDLDLTAAFADVAGYVDARCCPTPTTPS